MKEYEVFNRKRHETKRYISDIFPAAICWSSRRLSVTISSPPKHAISCLPRHLQDVLKKSWKKRNCYDLEKPFLTSIKEIVIIIE